MRGTSTTRRAPRGGRGGYEPRIVIRAREYQVWQLAVRGRTQRQIATEVGVTQVAVCRILQRIQDRILATLHRERVRYLILHYARADHVYAQAQEGWDRSCAERQRRTQRRTHTGKHGAVEQTTMSVVSETQPGDPRFLREQLRALAEQRDTFQLHALDWAEISRALERDLASSPDADEP